MSDPHSELLPVEATDQADVSDEVSGEAEATPKVNRRTLTLLGVAAAGAAVLLYMNFKPGPAVALAAPSAASDAKSAVRSFMEGGAGDLKLMETMLRDTQKVVDQFQQFPGVTQVPLAHLKTNPFQAVSPDAAPVALTDDAARKRRDADRAEALRVVQTLALQSLVVSDKRRTCLINSVLCAEGQQLDGFTVEKITPVSVIVKRGEYRFELRLQQ